VLTSKAMRKPTRCSIYACFKRYVFSDAERSFKCCTKGRKSLSENKSGRLFSIQKEAI